MKKRTWVTMIRLLFAMILLTGLVYPALVTIAARLFFNEKANGSLVSYKGRVAGSRLIGQAFDSTQWFHSRPSAVGYDPLPSGGSNLGPTSENLHELVNERYHFFIRENSLHDSTEIPGEMLFASGSGLDPHISPEAAILQINRIAAARGYDRYQRERLLDLVERATQSPQFYLFGEARINVLMLNLALDKL